MMLRNIVFILLFSFITFGGQAQDKLPKKERKKWKKKIRKLKPAEYKELVEEKESLKNDLKKQKKKNKELKAELEKLKEDQNSEATASESKEKGTESSEGVIFKVQIGAFRDKNKDLMKYTDHPHFSGETEGGFKKYTLGRFEEYWEANKFKKYLREMGVSDAWIVAYKDGKRVSMKDALEGAVQ